MTRRGTYRSPQGGVPRAAVPHHPEEGRDGPALWSKCDPHRCGIRRGRRHRNADPGHHWRRKGAPPLEKSALAPSVRAAGRRLPDRRRRVRGPDRRRRADRDRHRPPQRPLRPDLRAVRQPRGVGHQRRHRTLPAGHHPGGAAEGDSRHGRQPGSRHLPGTAHHRARRRARRTDHDQGPRDRQGAQRALPRRRVRHRPRVQHRQQLLHPRGFTIDGQQQLSNAPYPTTIQAADAFKDSVRGRSRTVGSSMSAPPTTART